MIDWGGTLLALTAAASLRSDRPAGEVYVLVALVWPVIFATFSLYDGRRNATLRIEVKNVLAAVCISIMALAALLYFTYRETSRALFLTFFFLDVIVLTGSRVLLYLYRRSLSGRKQARTNLLMVGAGQVGQSVVRELQKYAWADTNIIGYAVDDERKQGKELDGLPVLGTLSDLQRLAVQHRIDAAIAALPLHAHEQLVQTCKTLQACGVRVYVVPDLFALSFPSATLDGFGGIPVIDLGQPGIHGWPRTFKRVIDVIAAALGVVALSPFLALVAIAIKLDSPGPILYRQPRVGENGRVFLMFKFRSMRADSDPGMHREHVARLIRENVGVFQIDGDGHSTVSLKLENDPRITRVGKFIRKTSIDELPQLFNVLRGEMSLVGPRPPLPYEVELYKEWHKRRFEAIPGITGLWQVKGRNRVSFDEMVRMDLEYIEHQSFWLDLKILIQTPLAVVSGKGAG